jgi:hypothetical protein
MTEERPDAEQETPANAKKRQKEGAKSSGGTESSSRRRESRRLFDNLLDLRDAVIRGRRRMLVEVLHVIADTADAVDEDEETDKKDEGDEGDHSSSRSDRHERARGHAADGVAEITRNVNSASDRFGSRRRKKPV